MTFANSIFCLTKYFRGRYGRCKFVTKIWTNNAPSEIVELESRNLLHAEKEVSQLALNKVTNNSLLSINDLIGNNQIHFVKTFVKVNRKKDLEDF